MNSATVNDAGPRSSDLLSIKGLMQRAGRTLRARTVATVLRRRSANPAAGTDDTQQSESAVDQRQRVREERFLSAMIESRRALRRAFALELAAEHARRLQAEASETEARQALMFKEVAIQETQHRVKNTLQAAASLLSLHARATASADVRLALLDSYGRLHVLAKVHELLAGNTDDRQQVFVPALLQAAADALRQSFAAESCRISLQLTTDEVWLQTDDAIPLALLANEAMTNAWKHAFPDGSAGHIAVNLRCAPENTLILQITDNGVGIDPARDGGLGLKLIRGFAARLQGTLVFDRPIDTDGTAITLTVQRGATCRRESE